jgi:hypothetical protein
MGDEGVKEITCIRTWEQGKHIWKCPSHPERDVELRDGEECVPHACGATESSGYCSTDEGERESV